MANDLTPAWELLTAMADVQTRLSAIRRMAWERARLASAERTVVARATVQRTILGIVGGEVVWDDDDKWTANDTGDHCVVEITVMIRFPNGTSVTSAMTVIAGKDRWRVRAQITQDGLEEGQKVIWQGGTLDRGDAGNSREAIDGASKALVEAALKLDLIQLAGV